MHANSPFVCDVLLQTRNLILKFNPPESIKMQKLHIEKGKHCLGRAQPLSQRGGYNLPTPTLWRPDPRAFGARRPCSLRVLGPIFAGKFMPMRKGKGCLTHVPV
jgi:hypothetical protein